MLSRAKKWFSVRQGDGFFSYRATRSVMDLLIAEMIHRMEYNDKTKEPSPCLTYYSRILSRKASICFFISSLLK